jgi:hypothetical protein
VFNTHRRPVFALEVPPVVGDQATFVFLNQHFLSMLQFTEVRAIVHT